jgi:hypothetical protein
MEWQVEGAGSGERIVEVAAEVAGVADTKSVVKIFRRYCGDIAAAAAIGCERGVQMRPGSELSVRGIGGDEGEGGAGGLTVES